MAKLLLQTFGWVLVLFGVAAPLGLLYLGHQHEDEVATYRNTYESFGSLEDEEREALLMHLDTLISSREEAKKAISGLALKDMVRSIREGGAE